MEDISQLLNEINASVVYKKIRELEKDQRYEVKNLELVKTPFGKKICVKCADFQLTLPESWTEKFKKIHRVLEISKSKLFIVYKGTIDLPNGNTKLDIEFV